MHFRTMLDSQQVVSSGSLKRLMQAVEAVIGRRRVSYFVTVNTAPAMGWVFLTTPHDGAIKLPAELCYESVVHELLRLGKEEAQYPERMGTWQRRGWEIRKVRIDGQSGVLACAVWV